MTGCLSLDVTGRFSDSSLVPTGTMNGPRDLPVTTSRFELLMLVGVPMNIGFGSCQLQFVLLLRLPDGHRDGRQQRRREGRPVSVCVFTSSPPPSSGAP